MNEKTVLTLIDKFAQANLGELEFVEGDAKLVLRKETCSTGIPGIPSGAALPGTVHGGLPLTGHLGLSAVSNGASDGSEYITSPIVGTFYPSPGPDAPPFVRAGSVIKAGDTLCILEAMKMMNHLEAEFDCEIIAVKAASGDLVEFGQQLFEIKRAV